MLHFSKQEFARRLQLAQRNMADANLDGMLIFAQESMYWLTGYDTFGYCFFQCLVLKADGEITLLTRSADLRQAQHTSNLKNIVIWKDGADANPSIDLKAVAADMGLKGKRLGVEYDCHGLTAMNGKKVDAAFDGFASLEDASPIIPRLREVKSDEEVAYIIKASESADRALDAAIKTTAAGVSEGEILAAMQGAIFLDDGDYAGNEFIIGSAEDALLCRYKSGRRTLSENDQLTLEWAGAHAHYHSAMMRTLIVGEPMKEHEHHFEAAKHALLAVESAMQAGNTFGDVFAAHARVMDEAGLSEHRLNACGYSLGAVFSPCWMDYPMFYENNPQVIEPNMSLFAHMIIMDSASGAAMCLGQTYLTTNGAPKGLSRHPLEFIAL